MFRMSPTMCGGGCRCSALELDGTLLGSDLACFYEQKGGGVVV